MRKTKKTLAILAIVAMVFTMIPMQVFAADATTTYERIGGTTQYDTAAAIAQAGWTTADTAVIAVGATGNSYDALSAGPLAADKNAPILLTEGNRLTPVTKTTLQDLGVKNVIIVGGTGVIKQAVEDSIKALGISTSRLAGFDASETSVKVAQAIGSFDTLVLAGGRGEDALSISSIAAANGYPILYTNKATNLPDSVASYVSTLSGVNTSYVIGGIGVIQDAEALQLPGTKVRYGGYDAYDTNLAVIQGFASSLSYDKVYVANGQTKVDALAGAPLAAKTDSALVLTDNTRIPAAGLVSEKLNADSVVIALGGDVVISDSILHQIAYKGSVEVAPKITEVTSPDNKTLVVTFDKSVIDNTAQPAAVSVKKGADAVEVEKAVFSADKKTLTITTKADLAPSTELTITVTPKNRDAITATFTTPTYNEGLSVESVSTPNLTTVVITFNKTVDEIKAENFSISGLTVTAATLSDDKKVATLTVTGAEAGKDYELKVTGVKVNAEVQPDITKEYTAPEQNVAFKPTLEAKDTVLKSDGASSTLVTFKLLDAEGNLLTDAQDVEIALSSTFGNFAERRVSVQNGVATALFTSEALTSSKAADLTAQVVEAQDKNLIGLKAATSILLTPNPDTVDPTTGALMTEAEAYQADRVVVYFNKEVKVSDFVSATTGAVDPLKADIAVTTGVANDLTGGTPVSVEGLLPVEGNDKALQVILVGALTDNANVKVSFTDKRGTIAVPSTKAFKLTDARVPALLSVAREGLKTIKVIFSEPVDPAAAVAPANWSIDGKVLSNPAFGSTTPVSIAVGNFVPATGTDTRNVVTITLGKDATGNQIYFKSGAHSVQGANIGDWAAASDTANVMNTQTLDFTVPVDNTAPTATIEVQSPEQYVLSFDKDIEQNDAFLAANLKLQKYDKTTGTWGDVATPPIAVTNISSSGGLNKFLVETKTDWTVVYDTQTNNKNYYNDSYQLYLAKDLVTAASNGIKNAALSLPLSGALTAPDVVSPTIVNIAKTAGTTEGTSYDVTLSEPVKIGALANAEGLTPSQAQTAGTGIPTPTAYFVKKDNSKTVPGTVASTFVDEENKVIKVTPIATLDAADWVLVVGSISDDVGNTAASATKDFTVVAGTTPETDFHIIFAQADFDTDFTNLATADLDATYDYVFVKFNSAIAITGDYKNVLKTSNYALNGGALPTGTQIFANIVGLDDNDAVADSITIQLPEGTITRADTTVLNVSNYLESLDGKAIVNGGEKALPFFTTDADLVDSLKATLAIGYASGESATTVKSDLGLTSGISGVVSITWVSDNPAVIADTGVVTRPIYSAGDATVNLTATITKGAESETKTFAVKVLKKDFTATANGDATFTVYPDGYNVGEFAVADVAGTAIGTAINGVTFNVTYDNTTGVYTVAATGTWTAAQAADATPTITVTKDGKVVTLHLSIDAGLAGGTPSFTVIQ